MSILRTVILLPCHSLGDFSTHFRGIEADSLLTAWTIAWHPLLIAQTRNKPFWARDDEPIEDVGNTLLIASEVSSASLTEELRNKCQTNQGACLLASASRQDAWNDLQTLLGNTDCPVASQTSLELAADFYALGYGFLQVQLMTLKLRGSSNLNEPEFETLLVAAAQAAQDNDETTAKSKLTGCFDLLLEEKNNYYPVQPDLLPLVLMTESTIGKRLENQLANRHSYSILAPTDLLSKLKATSPDIWHKLKQAVDDMKVSIVGGLHDELRDNLLSNESTVNQLQLGREFLLKELDDVADVFTRRTFGFSTNLPGILDSFDFIGAIHCSLSGGTVPPASSSNIRWEGPSGASILSLATSPLDANDGGTFLGLSVGIGEQIDSAHTAPMLLVHWPGQMHFAFGDLIRINSYGPLFGRIGTLNDYFESIYDPGYGDTFTPDEYQFNHLAELIRDRTENPISRFSDYWRRLYAIRKIRFLCVIAALLNQKAKTTSQDLDNLQKRTESATTEQGQADIDNVLTNVLDELLLEICIGLGKKMGVKEAATEFLGINSQCYKRRTSVYTDAKHRYAAKGIGSVFLADTGDTETSWILGVPPMSISSCSISPETKLQEPGIIDDRRSSSGGISLRNEFFQVEIDTASGGLRSINQYNSRQNLVTQKLALRIPGERDGYGQPLTPSRYAKMICNDIKISGRNAASSKITTYGELIDGEQVVAEYQQTVRVSRGIQRVEFDVTIQPKIELPHNHNDYFCSRLAWKDSNANMTRSVQESKSHASGMWIEAPNFVEVGEGDRKLTLLTNGMPFHRRSQKRMLDTVLITAGETKREFRFAIGVGLGFSLSAAQDWMSPVDWIPVESVEKKTEELRDSGWFFHFNCKNVQATFWNPVFDEHHRITGVQIRLCETEGRGGELVIRGPRTLKSASQLNFAGTFLRELEVDKDKAMFVFTSSEYFQIQLDWNP